MSITTLHDLDLEDRTRALICWATRWDEISAALTGGGHGWMTADRADSSLTAAISHFAHPLLSADPENLYDLIRDLRDAVKNREDYELYGFLPDSLESDLGETYDRQHAEDLLARDVDLALFPLLFARSTADACRECQRIKQDVTAWHVATTGGRCEQHRLVLA